MVNPSGPRARLTAWLDWLLSERLRASPPPVLARSRVVVAAACFMSLFAVLFVLTAPLSAITVMCVPTILGYLGTLVLARRASSPVAPAMLLCGTMEAAFVVGVFLLEGQSSVATHAVHMLVPAFAVYLLGPRWALWLTVPLIVAVQLVFPLYEQSRLGPSSPPDPFYWPLHFAAGFSLVGVWALSALSGLERDKAQVKLEGTLEDLRDSQGKLVSVIESTDDMVLSLDCQGRLLTANTAAREMYRRRAGREPVVGQPFFASAAPALLGLWESRMAKALAGERLRVEEVYEVGGARLVLDVRISPMLGAGGRITGLTIFSRDITTRKEAETRLGEMHRTLVDVSRQAGMAEVATGVLHNVGNTLNSVNISAAILVRTDAQVTGGQPGQGDRRAARARARSWAPSSPTDPQGQKLPPYLFALSDQLQQERDAAARRSCAR